MIEAFQNLNGRVTPVTIGEQLPWSVMKKCVVVFENEEGDVCTLANDLALSPDFLPMAELQLRHLSLIRRLHDGESA